MREHCYLSRDWQPLQREEFLSQLFACKARLPPLLLFYLLENIGRENKMWGPPFLLGNVGVCVLMSYVCSRDSSPCSRLCICTCTSLACCSRWRSCCSGSDLRSTRPHLKHSGNITTINYWVHVRKGCSGGAKANCLTSTSSRAQREATLLWNTSLLIGKTPTVYGAARSAVNKSSLLQQDILQSLF